MDSDVSRDFLDRPVQKFNQRRRHNGWRRDDTLFVPPNALKMHSLVLPFLTFLCKKFTKLSKFTLQNILLRGWNSKIHILKKKNNLHGYKLVRAAKQYGLKKMQQVVQKESHKTVQTFTSFNQWELVCK